MPFFEQEYIQTQIEDSIAVKQQLLRDRVLLENIHTAAEYCIAAFQTGNKVILAGNGGSAADAQHIAAEFVSRFNFDRPGLPSIALTTDTSALTAIANDYGYDYLFQRQLEANGVAGDVFIGISTSGNSVNVLKALAVAKQKEIITIGLAGESGKIQTAADVCLSVPSICTPRIQESHILIGHIICAYVEDALFTEHKPT